VGPPIKSVLDSRQILAARTLASTGSFTLAGRHLSLTQSAVSHAIKALEEEIGCRLFTRTGKGVVVTPAGMHFLQYLDHILEQMEIARALVSPRTLQGKESLRVGASAPACDHILPFVTPAFQQEYPRRLVTFECGDNRRALDLVRSGLLDLCFTLRPTDRPETTYVHLFEDELRFVVAPDHPLARKGAGILEELEGHGLLFCPSGNNTAESVLQHLREQGAALRHGVELADGHALRTIALTGRAVTVLPPWSVSADLQSGALVSLPLGARTLVRHWGLVHLRKRTLTSMHRRFVELCQESIPGLVGRLQGRSAPTHEKKVPTFVPLAEPQLRYGVVAIAVGGVSGMLIESMPWIDAVGWLPAVC